MIVGIEIYFEKYLNIDTKSLILQNNVHVFNNRFYFKIFYRKRNFT